MPTPTVKPLPSQQAIVDIFADTNDHMVIKSPAGSGKTTTLGFCADKIPLRDQMRTVYLSYAKNNVTYASRYLPESIEKRTYHSIGLAAIRKVYPQTEVNQKKYEWFAQDIVKRVPGLSWRDKRSYQAALVNLVELTQVEMGDPCDPFFFDYLVERYNLDLPFGQDEAMVWTARLLERGEQELGRLTAYGDMIHFSVKLQLDLGEWKNLLVDEAQDMNPARLAMTEQMVGPQTRLAAVGDEYQAIYGFTGSHTNSLEQIIAKFDPKVCVQPVCLRCPKSHVDLARQVVSYIQAADWSIEGRIEPTTNREMLLTWGGWGPNVLVVSRTRRPLIEAAWILLKRGIPCYVRGTGIGQELCFLLDQAMKGREEEFDNIPALLRDWLDRKVTLVKARPRHTEMQIDHLIDQVDSLLVCWDAAKEARCVSVTAFKTRVQNLFSDEEKSGNRVELSTIHGAKGEEAPVIVHLQPEDVPHPKAVARWERDQERNLGYVADTRCSQKGHEEAGTLFLAQCYREVDHLLVC